MKCPECGKPTDVIESRQVQGGVRRRRQCFNGHRFTTREMAIEEIDSLLRRLRSLLALGR